MLPTKSRCIVHSLSRSFRTITKNYAAAALTEPLDEEFDDRKPRQLDTEVKITTLSNGIKVASRDTGGSISRISIASNAASRHENPLKLGLSQVMKNAAFMTNDERTSLRTVRETQEIGGSVDCTTTREFQVRNASFLRSKMHEVMENLAPGFSKPVFHPWDVSDAKSQTRTETASICMDHMAVNMEMLHNAAYRNGLGNSLYCNDLILGTLTPEDLNEFALANYVGDRMTVSGVDVSHDELVRYVKELLGNLPKGQTQTTTQQKYHGGEMRKYTDNQLAYVSLVAEGAGMMNADLAVFLVLQKVLGGSTYVKWGSNTQSSRLGKAAKAVTDGPLSINALNISYSDSGLFGFNVITSPEVINPVMKAAVGQMSAISKGELSADELLRAKTQAKSSINMVNESKQDMLDDLSKQVAFKGAYSSNADAVSKIEQVSQDNIVQAAKKLLSGKSTLVATGNTSLTPYIDELL